MPGTVSAPKKYAVRNFLMRCVRESDPDAPCRLMTELALCEKFQVNRETVRNAISELEISNVVLRRPGKKGIWANPGFSRMRKKLIGIINGSPSEPYHHYFQNGLLARLTLSLEEKLPVIYQYPVLSDDVSLALSQLEMYGFDALIYFHFTPVYDAWLAGMERLVEKSFPVIAVSNVTDDPLPAPFSCNMIGMDQKGFAARKVNFLLENAAPSLLFFGQENKCNHFFLKAMEEKGKALAMKEFISANEVDPAFLAKKIEKEKIRSIYCASGRQIICPILKLLSSDPEKYGNITFYCGANGDAVTLKEEYKGVNIVVSHQLHFAPERAVGIVEEKLLAMLSDGKNQFESVFLS